MIVGAVLAALVLTRAGLPPVHDQGIRSPTANVHEHRYQVDWRLAVPLGLALAAGVACVVYRPRHGTK